MTRVLLVEDNRLYRACLRPLIERIEGCTVAAEAETGPAAIEVARSAPFDLITLDLSLPGLSGLEVLRDVKQRQGLAVVLVGQVLGVELYRLALGQERYFDRFDSSGHTVTLRPASSRSGRP